MELVSDKGIYQVKNSHSCNTIKYAYYTGEKIGEDKAEREFVSFKSRERNEVTPSRMS